ncbi:MAG: lipid-A-disaccharide synthase [Deltaproteobacteria bacterium]|nr:lipid-A-disaccharide synthase [Deltaproteobacteria bacterium]
MQVQPPHLLMVAGEDSGDLHAARLAAALKSQLPGCQVSGIGGAQMEAAGVEIFFPSARLAVVGIFEVVRRIPDIIAGYLALRRQLADRPPSLVILVDFPDFNLKLAAPLARRHGIPVIYYISPQVWAWRPGRVATINRLVEKILVILPFEAEFYRRRQVAVQYVGHPLVDEFKDYKVLPRNPASPLIALLPGSRPGEIRRLLPIMLTTARLFHRTHPQSHFIIPMAPSVSSEEITAMLPRGIRIKLVRGPLCQALAGVSLALVASGTATLETALAEVPMIVVYKVNRLSYEIGRRLITVPFICLVNLIADEEVVPELIQDQARPEIIAARMRKLFDDQGQYQTTRRRLRDIKRNLGHPGAAERAAQAIIENLTKKS